MKKDYHSKKILIPIGQGRYLNPADPLYYEKILTYVNPSSPEAHYKVAQHMEQKGEWKQAVHHYQEAINVPSVYTDQAKRALQSLIRTDGKENKQSEHSSSPVRRVPLYLLSIAITLLLLNLLFLWIIWQPPSDWALAPPATEEALPLDPVRYAEEPAGMSSDPVVLFPEEKQEWEAALPYLMYAVNMVRTALQAYLEEQGEPPADLALLTQDYPGNYLSYIPLEVVTSSNHISSIYTGTGGWVYNPEADSIEKMFYPNLSQPTAVKQPLTSSPLQALHLPFEPIVIFIGKNNFNLYLQSGKHIFKEIEIGHGKEDRTPSGSFQVTDRVLWPQGDQEGIFGSAGLGMGELAIHGTHQEDSIGATQSLGCIRLPNDHMVSLFHLIPQGSRVIIVEEHVEEILLLEPLPDVEKIIPEQLPPIEQQATNRIFEWLS